MPNIPTYTVTVRVTSVGGAAPTQNHTFWLGKPMQRYDPESNRVTPLATSSSPGAAVTLTADATAIAALNNSVYNTRAVTSGALFGPFIYFHDIAAAALWCTPEGSASVRVALSGSVTIGETGATFTFTADLWGPFTHIYIFRRNATSGVMQDGGVPVAMVTAQIWARYRAKISESITSDPPLPQKVIISDTAYTWDFDRNVGVECWATLRRLGRNTAVLSYVGNFDGSANETMNPLHRDLLAAVGINRFAYGIYDVTGDGMPYHPARPGDSLEPPSAAGIDQWSTRLRDLATAGGFSLSNCAWFKLSDERGWSVPWEFDFILNQGGIATGAPQDGLAMLRAYLQTVRDQAGNLVSPSYFGAVAWTDLFPLGKRARRGTLQQRRLYYWTIRFLARTFVDHYAAHVASFQSKVPAAQMLANWNYYEGRLNVPGNHVSLGQPDILNDPDNAIGGPDWLEMGRAKGGAYFTEDWWSGHFAQFWGFQMSRMAAARRRHGAGASHSGGHFVPRGWGNEVGTFGWMGSRMCCFALGQGSKIFDAYFASFEWHGPTQAYLEQLFFANQGGMVTGLADFCSMVAATEDLVWPGQPPAYQVAVLKPRSSYLWDKGDTNYVRISLSAFVPPGGTFSVTYTPGADATKRIRDDAGNYTAGFTISGSYRTTSDEITNPAVPTGTDTTAPAPVVAWTQGSVLYVEFNERLWMRSQNFGGVWGYFRDLDPAQFSVPGYSVVAASVGGDEVQDAAQSILQFAKPDYSLEAVAIYFALAHANIGFDWIEEEDCTPSGLAPYKALYVTEPCVASGAQDAIATWVNNGGVLHTCANAATRDRYSDPYAAAGNVGGLAQAARFPAWIPALHSISGSYLASEGGASATFWGNASDATDTRSAPTLPGGATVVATFPDGSAAVARWPVGSGWHWHSSGFPALAYLHSSTPPPSSFSELITMPTGWSAALRDWLTRPVLAAPASGGAGVLRHVVASATLVDARPLESAGGWAVVVTNCENADKTVTLTMRPPFAPASAHSYRQGSLSLTNLGGGAYSVTIPVTEANNGTDVVRLAATSSGVLSISASGLGTTAGAASASLSGGGGGGGGGAATGWITSLTEPANPRSDFDGYLGHKITVGADPITVTALGRWVVSGLPHIGTHEVRIVRVSDKVVVASASVNLSGAPAGAFKYVDLGSPVTLAANTSYYVLAHEAAGGDAWLDFPTDIQVTAVAARHGTTYVLDSSPNAYVEPGDVPGQAYGVPTFKYSSGAGPDTTPPQVVSRSVNGATLTITYNEPLHESFTPGPSAFMVKFNGAEVAVTDVHVSGSTVVLTLAAAAVASDVVSVTYTVPS